MKIARILLLITLALLSVSSFACSSGGGGGGSSNGGGLSSNSAYTTAKDELQNSVIAYATEHSGAFPNLSGTYSVSGCSDCNIIDISAVLTSNGGIMREVPDGCYKASGGDNDNCDGGAVGCSADNHYIWLIDLYGNIYSKCMGSDCDSNNATGYQGVWP
jgi:hypothetical protein